MYLLYLRGGEGKQFEHIVTTGSIPEDVIALADVLYVLHAISPS